MVFVDLVFDSQKDDIAIIENDQSSREINHICGINIQSRVRLKGIMSR